MNQHLSHTGGYAQHQTASCSNCRTTNGYLITNGVARLCPCRRNRQQQKTTSQPAHITSRLPNHRPPTADSQVGIILAELRKAGTRGVTTTDLLDRFRILRVGARLSEIRSMGYSVATVLDDRTGVARYFLEAEPEQPKPLRQYGARKHETADEQPSLFAEGAR